jgi:hypothetical protein
MDTVNFTSKINHIYFEYVDFHVIFNAHFCTESISDCGNLKCSADFVTQNIFKSAKSRNSEKLILEHKYLMKILNDGGPKWSLVAPLTAWEKVRKSFIKYEQQKM